MHWGAQQNEIRAALGLTARECQYLRTTDVYGGRYRCDLCFEKELHSLDGSLPRSRHESALSGGCSSDGWTARAA
jgi:hypothetical protein